MTKPVSAGGGQPVHFRDIGLAQPDAVRDISAPVAIIAATAAPAIEQPAGDVGREQLAGDVILKLVEAAFAAAVAQGFPFGPAQLGERALPESLPQRTHRSSSETTPDGP